MEFTARNNTISGNCVSCSAIVKNAILWQDGIYAVGTEVSQKICLDCLLAVSRIEHNRVSTSAANGGIHSYNKYKEKTGVKRLEMEKNRIRSVKTGKSMRMSLPESKKKSWKCRT